MNTPSAPWMPAVEETQSLMDVALGRRSADLAITNATIANVYTGEWLSNHTIRIWRHWIAYVGPDAESGIGPDTEVIDAGAKPVIPGLIDGHTHLAWLFCCHAFLKAAVAGGTTTIITETLEPYPICGVDGVVDLLASFADQPVKILATAPPMISISRNAHGIDAADLQTLLERPDIVGLGESYWQSVLQDPDTLLPLMTATRRSGKLLEGHSAGASPAKLMAYAATGVSSCHEPIQADEVLERLRLGIYVMAREGSIRSDLDKIAAIRDSGADLRRLILVTDGVTPGDLAAKGYMEHVVQKAVDHGFAPMDAIRMATINVAEHFHLDDVIGGIAPAKQADLLILPDRQTIQPEIVVSQGTVAARNGELLLLPRSHRFQSASLNSVHLDRPLTAADFVIPVAGPNKTTQVRVIKMVSPLVTTETQMTLPVGTAGVAGDPDRDVIKIAALDRSRRSDRSHVGLIAGFGLQTGAFASSAAWDCSAIIVVGADDNDMATAVNRIHALQGGAVVVHNGNIVAELALPVFGLMSELDISALADAVDAINSAVASQGVVFDDPLLSLVTLTGAAIPFLRICEEGYVNLKNGENLPTIII